MKKQLARALGAVALVATGFSAHGGGITAEMANVTLTGWAYGNGNAVQATSYGGQAGGFIGSLTGTTSFNATPFVTYCIELSEHFSFGANAMTGYNVVNGASYFGARRGDAGIAERLGQLMTFVADHPTQVDSSAESTSLQLAIWNLVYDPDYSVTTLSAFNDTSSYRTQANVLLAGAQSTVSRYNVFALEKAGSQDFLLLQNRVPEPASLALVAVALAGLGVARRKRG